jgi:hypothetical protein
VGDVSKCRAYLVEVCAEGGGIFVDLGKVETLAVLRASEGNASPRCVDVVPDVGVFLDWKGVV